jgi:hypothetical protein
MAVIDTIARMINLKQNEDEDLISYVRQFKVQRDIMKEQLGPNLLDSFVEWAPKYNCITSSDSDPDIRELEIQVQQGTMKEMAMEKFYAALIIRNSDKSKYGTLHSTLVSQYSMTANQYPKTLAEATKVLEIHWFDPTYYERKKKSKEKEKERENRNNKEKDEDDKTKTETSFAQSKSGATICYCCGSRSHKALQCPE